MTRQEKQRINEAKLQWSATKYPLARRDMTDAQFEGNYGGYSRTDTDANGLTACICDYLKYSGWQAERISSQGQARVNYKVDPYTGRRTGGATGVTWTPGQGTKGTADISATISGHSVKIEVKQNDKQSEVQKKYQQSIEAAGGQYWLVHNMTEFFEFYDGFINYINKLKAFNNNQNALS